MGQSLTNCFPEWLTKDVEEEKPLVTEELKRYDDGTDFFLPIFRLPKDPKEREKVKREKREEREEKKPQLLGGWDEDDDLENVDRGMPEDKMDKILFEDQKKLDVFKNWRYIGAGSYGKVFSAVNRKTNKCYALKICPIKTLVGGLPKDIVREISFLHQVKNHPYFVHCYDIILYAKDRRMSLDTDLKAVLVLEKVECTLLDVIKNVENALSNDYITHFAKQIAVGLKFCFKAGIVHRDLKPSNILITKMNVVKIADLGQSRMIEVFAQRKFSRNVATLRYRAPELLLGSDGCETALDIWAFGCILVEMAKRKQFFCGTNPISQIEEIFKILGTPTKEEWKAMKKYPHSKLLKLPHYEGTDLIKVVPELKFRYGISLLERMFCYDPKQRINAIDILKHIFFKDINTNDLPPIQLLFKSIPTPIVLQKNPFSIEKE